MHFLLNNEYDIIATLYIITLVTLVIFYWIGKEMFIFLRKCQKVEVGGNYMWLQLGTFIKFNLYNFKLEFQ